MRLLIVKTEGHKIQTENSICALPNNRALIVFPCACSFTFYAMVAKLREVSSLRHADVTIFGIFVSATF